LQTLCDSCHRRKTIASHRPISTAEEAARACALHARLDAREPLLDCDRPDWATVRSGVARERRAAFHESVAQRAQEILSGSQP
jgi:hypothetical protein